MLFITWFKLIKLKKLKFILIYWLFEIKILFWLFIYSRRKVYFESIKQSNYVEVEMEVKKRRYEDKTCMWKE